MRHFLAILTLLAALPALAQAPATAPAMPSNADIAAQVSKLAGNKNPQQIMGQVMVLGTLLGCTQKTVGKPATEAFYHEMDRVGKTAEHYCKKSQATEARALLLSTFAAKKNDPVLKAALACYDTQKAMIEAVGGKQLAADSAHYARWLRDPEIAKAEMKEADICR